jgi:NADH-quinone oxidoreductase subunit M
MKWLSAVLWTPAIGAVILAFVPRARHTAHRWIAFAASIVTLGFAVAMWVVFETGEAGMQLTEKVEWIRSFGASYSLGVDGISLFLVILTAFLTPVCIAASWKEGREPKRFMILLLALETAVIGVFLASDLLLFYVFWEAMLVPMYFLIGQWGYERRVYAAVKFFLYTLLGGVVMLAGILAWAFQVRGEIGVLTFDLATLQEVSLGLGAQRWLFLAFAVAFAVKIPLFPVHTWLPDAHTEAPTAGSVMLAGVLLKMGGYGFIRYALTSFPAAAREAAPYIIVLALIGIVYGALVATMQRDLKRLIAYSSVSHLGFIVLGIFAFTVTSVQGATLQMVNHGLATGALFLLVGMLADRRHTRQIDEFGGLARVMPLFAAAFLLSALASLGLPGLNGFVGEFLILVGTFGVHKVEAIIAASGVVLAALYLLWAYQRVWQGPIVHEVNRTLPDLDLREKLLLSPMLAAIVVLGIFPKPLLDRMSPSVERVVSRVASVDGTAVGAP